MRACDAEGLYWTVLALWLQLAQKRETLKHLTVAKRLDKRGSLLGLGACSAGTEMVRPQHPVLAAYLKRKKLLVPLELFAAYFALRRKHGIGDKWRAAVRAREAKEHLPPCPPQVFDWLTEQYA